MSDFEKFFIFTRPTFLEGTARAADFWGSLNTYFVSETHQKADYFAIFSDWTAVGDDLRNAMAHYINETQSIENAHEYA